MSFVIGTDAFFDRIDVDAPIPFLNRIRCHTNRIF